MTQLIVSRSAEVCERCRGFDHGLFRTQQRPRGKGMNQQNHAQRTTCPSTRRDIDLRAKVLNSWSHQVLQDRTICAVLFSVAQMRLGSSSCSPSVADLVLEHLCPAIQNILEDGLRDHKLDYVIGQSRNHSWKVVEISTRIGILQLRFHDAEWEAMLLICPHVCPGPSTRILQSLVSKIRRCPELSSHSMRLRAFIMGLLK